MATKKMPKRLVALSSSAIASIYFAGLLSTRAAADGLAGEATAPTPVATPAESGGGAAAVAPSVVVGAQAPRRGRAPSSAPAPRTPAQTAPAPSTPAQTTPAASTPSTSTVTPPSTTTTYKDGAYSGTGSSRFGTVSVSVNIAGGQIANVQISRVTTSYPVSRIASLPSAVVKAQSANVNVISGATYSSQAFKQAVQQALSQASA
jgi:uncharacterized protein with FMN-binding domain